MHYGRSGGGRESEREWGRLNFLSLLSEGGRERREGTGGEENYAEGK